MEKENFKKVGKVLAEGEVTGHAHVLEDVEGEVLEDQQKVRHFKLKKATKLNHEEHKTIVLPKKSYKSDRVVETDPFEGERRVAD